MSDWSLKVISGEQTVDLSDGISYILTGLDGIGMAPAHRISQQGPQQHGASDVGYRLDPRTLVIGLLVKGGDAATWFAARSALLQLFRPADGLVSLQLVSGSFVRQIDAAFTTQFDKNSMGMPVDPDLRSTWQPVSISLECPDPTWYDPSGQSVTYGIGGSGQAMNVPLAVPWSVGASAINTSRQVNYAGTWDAWPIVTINGPINSPVLTNTTLGDKLDFTGVNIAAGGKRVIDCRYGYKTVVDENGANKVSDLTSDSNLATFRIGAHPSPLNGTNSIAVSGTGLTAATEVYLQFNPRYVGV